MPDAPGPCAELQITVKGPSKLRLQVAIAGDRTVRELKQALADTSGVPADRQRLIYSGAVWQRCALGRAGGVLTVHGQDGDALSACKIQSSHTIHMVEGAACPAPAPLELLPPMYAGQSLRELFMGLNLLQRFDALQLMHAELTGAVAEVAGVVARMDALRRDFEETAATRQALLDLLAHYAGALGRAQEELARARYRLYLVVYAAALVILVAAILAGR